MSHGMWRICCRGTPVARCGMCGTPWPCAPGLFVACAPKLFSASCLRTWDLPCLRARALPCLRARVLLSVGTKRVCGAARAPNKKTIRAPHPLHHTHLIAEQYFLPLIYNIPYMVHQFKYTILTLSSQGLGMTWAIKKRPKNHLEWVRYAV